MRKVQKKPVKVVKELSESSSDDEDTSISEEAENVTNEKNILSDVSSGNEVLANDHNTESTSESEEEPASAAAPEPKASLNPTATKKTRGDSIANIILEVIKDGGGKSAVSFVFIKKYLKQKYEFDNLLYIKKAMMKLLKDDVIYNKTKGHGCTGSFLIRVTKPAKKTPVSKKAAAKVLPKAAKAVKDVKKTSKVSKESKVEEVTSTKTKKANNKK